MRRLSLRDTDAAHLSVVHSITLDGFDHTLEVVGNPEWASYEWVIRRGGEVEHSDCGYGIAAVALRDGLVAYYGVPR